MTTTVVWDDLKVNPSDHRAPIWWGIIMLLVIETVVFGSLITTYFYLKAHNADWPPLHITAPDLTLPTINVFVLLLSSVPIFIADRGIRSGNEKRLKWGLGIGIVLGATFLFLKYLEYRDLAYNWETHAYGSIVWTITGFHSAHVITLLLKTIVMLVIAFRGFFHAERNIGVQVNGLYWHFVVFVWIPLYSTIYLSPRFL